MGSKMQVRPPALEAGARVALLAPAGPLLERDDLARSTALCQSLGLEPVLGAHAGERYGYLAGRDAERLVDLNAALRDPDIHAIWCIRGGYGVTRILDQVDTDAFGASPKPVIGFSDITALLLGLHQATGVVTFHAPMTRTPLTPFSRGHFERVLRRTAPAGVLEGLAPPPGVLAPRQGRVVPLRRGVAEGPLIGGNLTLLHCLIGTRHFPDLSGAILFLEDVGEDLYRVDRMLAQLRMIGALQRLAGVIIGQFTDLKRGTSDGALGFDEVLSTYLEPLGIPVAYGFPIGHVEDQWTLPIGARARFDAGAGTVELLEAAVR